MELHTIRIDLGKTVFHLMHSQRVCRDKSMNLWWPNSSSCKT